MEYSRYIASVWKRDANDRIPQSAVRLTNICGFGLLFLCFLLCVALYFGWLEAVYPVKLLSFAAFGLAFILIFWLFLLRLVSYPFRYMRARSIIRGGDCIENCKETVMGLSVCGKGASFHHWNGCKCGRCGKNRENAREDEHEWKHCFCTRCGKSRNSNHDWRGCSCYVCSKKRDEEHKWDGCCCSACGKIIPDARLEDHDWEACRCKKCGTKRDEAHEWDGCTCEKCKKTRNEAHDWDGCRCKRCKQSGNHDWDGCKCSRCGQLHDWEQTGSSSEEIEMPEGYWIILTTYSYRCRRCGEEKTDIERE